MSTTIAYVGTLEFHPALEEAHRQLVTQYAEQADKDGRLGIAAWRIPCYLTEQVDHEGTWLSDEVKIISAVQELLGHLGIQMAGMVHYESWDDSDDFGYLHIHPDGTFALAEGIKTYCDAEPYTPAP